MRYRTLALGLALIWLAGCTSLADRAERAARAGDWDEAYRLYQQAAAEEPDDPSLPVQAERARREALAMHREQARKARAAGDLAAAIAALQRALRLEEDPTLASELAEVVALHERRRAEQAIGQSSELAKAGQLTAAERAVREALALAVTDDLRARAMAQLGQVEAAQRAAHDAIQQAQALLAEQRWAEALAAFQEQGWRDHPHVSEGIARCRRHLEHDEWLRRGDSASQAGQFIEAQQCYERACQAVDSTDVRARLQVIMPRAAAQVAVGHARTALAATRLEQAWQALHTALAHDVECREAHELLLQLNTLRAGFAAQLAQADALAEQLRWEQACSLYEGVLAHWCDAPAALAGRDRCRAEIEREALLRRAHHLAMKRAWPKALTDLERICAIRPDPIAEALRDHCTRGLAADQHLGVADTKLAAGQLTAAEAALLQVQAAEPDHPALRERYATLAAHQSTALPILDAARAAHANQNWVEAIALYERVLAIWCDCEQAIRGLELARAQQPLRRGRPR
jgi:tetratricopeptide (TPR) repeat protein